MLSGVAGGNGNFNILDQFQHMTLKTKNPETVGGQFRGYLRGPALWEETAVRSLSWIKDGGVREEEDTAAA